LEKVGEQFEFRFAISRADVADLMLRVLKQPETIKQVMGVAY
jgi:hypothetical protein